MTYAVHSDHLNTPRRLTDANGQVVWQWAYSAFGDEKPTIAKYRFANLDVTPNPGVTSFAEFVFNLRGMGQYFDMESGLRYNYFRSLMAIGRYTQPDPIGLGGGLNRIGHVGGNPLNYTDPTGLLISSTVGGVLRDTTLGEAATFGAPGNAAAAAGMATAAAGAVGYGAGARVIPPLLRDIITGREYKFGDDFRAAPWGNRTGHELGRWPHYHRRGTDGQGNTIPGQGIWRHRPWETKSTDTNMCHRF